MDAAAGSGSIAPGKGALPQRPRRKRTHLTETFRTHCRDSAIPPGSPALQPPRELGARTERDSVAGATGELSPGSRHARSQSEGAWAGRLLRVRSEREAEPSSDPDPGCRLLSAAASDATSQVRPDVACAGRAGSGLPGPPAASSPVITSEDHPAPMCPCLSAPGQ